MSADGGAVAMPPAHCATVRASQVHDSVSGTADLADAYDPDGPIGQVGVTPR